MDQVVRELFPEPGIEHELKGLYLREDLRGYPDRPTPLVYANFIASLDGRIAVPHPVSGLTVPAEISNPRDWRLFQELAIQSDVILSSGRYLRDYAEGRAQEILRVYDDPAFADLAEWRRERGLGRYPAIAVISASLDFPIPAALTEGDRQVVILTVDDAPADRKRELVDHGLEVINVGKRRVHGPAAVERLHALGFHLIYSAAGPQVLHLLLEGHVLNRFYITIAFRALGGDPFSSILQGSLLNVPAEFSLQRLFLDTHAPGPGGQMFMIFEPG